MKALRAPLKFPASLHDKVISMRHLDTDKTNDPMYLEKAKFWDRQLLSLARQLHIQLLSDPAYRGGKDYSLVDRGLWEHEILDLPPPIFEDPDGPAANELRAPWGRGGVPFPKKLGPSIPTRIVPAQEAVLRRFGNWAEFLTFEPMDELFSIESQDAKGSTESGVEKTNADVVVKREVAPVDLNHIQPIIRLRSAREGQGELTVTPLRHVKDQATLAEIFSKETSEAMSCREAWLRQPNTKWIRQMVEELKPEKQRRLRQQSHRIQDGRMGGRCEDFILEMLAKMLWQCLWKFILLQ
eukprot:symbB.v1.2.000579.t1/scaffold3.1/size669525/19